LPRRLRPPAVTGADECGSSGSNSDIDGALHMTKLSLGFDLSTVTPEIGAPAPDRLISGDPVFTTWSLEETDAGLYAGVWQSTPGKWHIVYDEWEYFNILEGRSVVTSIDGEEVYLKAGDRHILRPGFKGTWEVLETTKKDYVTKV